MYSKCIVQIFEEFLSLESRASPYGMVTRTNRQDALAQALCGIEGTQFFVGVSPVTFFG